MNDQIKAEPSDFGTHVVAINLLVAQLNKASRQTYKPDVMAIDNVITKLKHHCSMIQRLIDEAKV